MDRLSELEGDCAGSVRVEVQSLLQLFQHDLWVVCQVEHGRPCLCSAVGGGKGKRGEGREKGGEGRGGEEKIVTQLTHIACSIHSLLVLSGYAFT